MPQGWEAGGSFEADAEGISEWATLRRPRVTRNTLNMWTAKNSEFFDFRSRALHEGRYFLAIRLKHFLKGISTRKAHEQTAFLL